LELVAVLAKLDDVGPSRASTVAAESALTPGRSLTNISVLRRIEPLP